MLRRSIHRLETVPLVGAWVSRARPAVWAFYRVLGACRTAPILRRRQLARRIPRLIRQPRLPADFVRRLFAFAWLCIAPLRPLLYDTAVHRSYRRRLQRRLLSAFLALADPYYRRVFARFGRMIEGSGQRSGREGERTGILMMIGTLGPGGSERQLVTTLQELRARGERPLELACVFLSSPMDRFFLPKVEAAGIPVTTLGTAPVDAVDRRAAAAIEALPSEIGAVTDYAALLAAKRPKVAHLWLDEINVKGGLAAVATGVPRIVLSLRSQPPYNFGFHQPYMREGYRWLARQPGVSLINNSEAGARAYEAWLGLPGGAIGCIHNGFRFDAAALDRYCRGRDGYRARVGIPQEAPLVGGVFRMSEEKRPLLWLEIATRVRRQVPAARFLIVGDGPLRNAVERRAAAADLAGSVTLVGHEREALAAIVDMDVLLLTSRIEGLPNVLVEAQALGVPVVTTSAGGAAETLAPGATGHVLDSDDPDKAAVLLVNLLRDAAWRENAGAAARAFVAGRFGIAHAVDQIFALYQQQPPATMPASRFPSADPQGRFEFGKNWYLFVKKSLSSDAVKVSKRHLLDFIARDDLAGLSLLDIGCGSGLHALAAVQAGAATVHCFDYDPNSVTATRYVQSQAGNPPNWTVEQGSILDDGFIARLPFYDLVYSWGVLHHTGNVWHALRNAASRVRPGGLFYIALYSADVQIDPPPDFWLDVKRKYVSSGWLRRRYMDFWYVWRFEMAGDIHRLRPFLRILREYKKNRGMSKFTDIRDWLGGWPMQFVYDKEAVDFVEALGFKLHKIATGQANTEFLFVREAAA